jgi:hypothetical protein
LIIGLLRMSQWCDPSSTAQMQPMQQWHDSEPFLPTHCWPSDRTSGSCSQLHLTFKRPVRLLWDLDADWVYVPRFSWQSSTVRVCLKMDLPKSKGLFSVFPK